MTNDQLQTIKAYMHASICGEALPDVPTPTTDEVMQALRAPFAGDDTEQDRRVAVERVGLVALEVLLHRLTAGLRADRQMSLMGVRTKQ